MEKRINSEKGFVQEKHNNNRSGLTPVISISEKGIVQEKSYNIKSMLTAVILTLNLTGVYCWITPWVKNGLGIRVAKSLSLGFAIVIILLNWMHAGRIGWFIEWNDISSRKEAVKIMCLFVFTYSALLQTAATLFWRKHVSILADKLESSWARHGKRVILMLNICNWVFLFCLLIFAIYVPYKVYSDVKHENRSDIIDVRMWPFIRGTILWDINLTGYCVLIYTVYFRCGILECFLIIISYHTYKEFQLMNYRIQNVTKPSLVFFENLREHFENIVSFIDTTNKLLSFVAFLSFASSVPMLCFTIYNYVRHEVSEDESILFLHVLAVPSIPTVAFLFAGSYIHMLSKSVEGPLFRIGMTTMDEITSRSMLVTRVTTSRIGITAFGLFLIEKSTVLTLVGTMITYIVVVLQFAPTAVLDSSNTNSNCSC